MQVVVLFRLLSPCHPLNTLPQQLINPIYFFKFLHNPLKQSMEAKSVEGKRREKNNIDEEDEEDMEEEGTETMDDKKKKLSGKRGPSGSSGGSSPRCQAERCGADLTDAKRYHRRHKVCELHAKAAVVIVAGLPQRFCQQCSRFHELSEFDETKRSCRRRLAGHNERRRKSSSGDSCGYGEGSSSRKGFSQITLPAAANASYKHFQFR